MSTLVYTSSIRTGDILFGDCSLYAYLDSIEQSAITNYTDDTTVDGYENCAIEIGPVNAVGVEGDPNFGYIGIGPVSITASLLDYTSGEVGIGPLWSVGSEGDPNFGVASIGPVTVFGEEDSIVIDYNAGNISIGPVWVASYEGYLDENTGDVEIGPVGSVGAEGDVSIGFINIGPVTAFGYAPVLSYLATSWPTWTVLIEGQAPVPRLHEVFYGSNCTRLHQVSYNLGDLPAWLHTISWTTEGSRTHSISYESILAIPSESSNRLHEVFYEALGSAGANAYHSVSYGVTSLVSAYTLHEVLYSAYSSSAVNNFHTVSYSSFIPVAVLHEALYQSVVEAYILHESGWKADTEQRRLHETRYHSISTTSIIDAGLITVGDGGLNTYDFMEVSITADEDSPYWQCEMTLKDSQDYIRFPRDTAFVVSLFDVDFNFIVDSRSLQRSIDDQGNYQETCTITGLSPLVAKSRPRADRLTKTWDTPIMASAVVTELLGANAWNLVDWMIPAYRLAAERADPLSVARQVAEAAGGLIESEPDGGIVCRHRWPTSIAGLDDAVADHELDERVIYSANEAPTQDELIDRVRIYDSEAGFQDRLEYVPNRLGDNDDPRNGILYAFVSPWREGLRIVTTRPSVISVGAATEGTRSISDSNDDYPAEVITFTERTSSTAYPIMTLTSLDWLDEDLGAVVYTPYATTIESGNGSYGGYSLAKVEYVARYLSVPVHCAEPIEEIEAQFLLLEDI